MDFLRQPFSPPIIFLIYQNRFARPTRERFPFTTVCQRAPGRKLPITTTTETCPSQTTPAKNTAHSNATSPSNGYFSRHFSNSNFPILISLRSHALEKPGQYQPTTLSQFIQELCFFRFFLSFYHFILICGLGGVLRQCKNGAFFLKFVRLCLFTVSGYDTPLIIELIKHFND
jgi:hypothetical protein